MHVASRLMHRFRLMEYYSTITNQIWQHNTSGCFFTIPIKAYNKVNVDTKLEMKWAILVFDEKGNTLFHAEDNTPVDLSLYPEASYIKICFHGPLSTSYTSDDWEKMLYTYVVQDYYAPDNNYSLLLFNMGFTANGDGTYSLAGLTDISEAEALNILIHQWNYVGSKLPVYSVRRPYIRAIIPTDEGRSFKMENSTFGAYWRLLEVASFCDKRDKDFEIIVSNPNGNIFSSAYSLREIWGIFDVRNWQVWGKTLFMWTYNLEYARFKSLYYDLSLKSCRNINYETLKYLIDNAVNDKAVNVIVHANTYSYLTGTTPPTERVKGTTEEWQALMAAAVEKQISFVTA